MSVLEIFEDGSLLIFWKFLMILTCSSNLVLLRWYGFSMTGDDWIAHQEFLHQRCFPVIGCFCKLVPLHSVGRVSVSYTFEMLRSYFESTGYKLGQILELQSGQEVITKWGKGITKWGREYKVGQRDYKVGQGIQSRPVQLPCKTCGMGRQW